MQNKWLAKGVEYYPETDTILLSDALSAVERTTH